jgi:hypothetical protein
MGKRDEAPLPQLRLGRMIIARAEFSFALSSAVLL